MCLQQTPVYSMRNRMKRFSGDRVVIIVAELMDRVWGENITTTSVMKVLVYKSFLSEPHRSS